MTSIVNKRDASSKKPSWKMPDKTHVILCSFLFGIFQAISSQELREGSLLWDNICLTNRKKLRFHGFRGEHINFSVQLTSRLSFGSAGPSPEQEDHIHVKVLFPKCLGLSEFLAGFFSVRLGLFYLRLVFVSYGQWLGLFYLQLKFGLVFLLMFPPVRN